MPRHRSAAKRARTSKEARARNRTWRSRVRAAIKALRSEKDKAQAQQTLRQATSLLDKAAKEGAIRHRAASRTKSQLAKLADNLS